MTEKQNKQKRVEVLEQGNIYFCYRPKVEDESVEGLDDVQRFYIVLKPHGKQSYRMMAIGQKHLPNISDRGQQAWGFVESVSDNPKKIEEGLREQHYRTKTRGERTQPAGRPVGEGVYDIVRHKDRTHLIYALELPEEPGEAQNELNIEPEGSYVLQIKNPDKSSPKGVGLRGEQKADFPQHLQDRFENHRFISAAPPDFLDYEGAELLLIAASADISKELGIDLDPQEETEAKAEIFNDLRMRKSRHPIAPLMKGEWR